MAETIKANTAAEKIRIVSFINKTGPIVSNGIAKSLNLNSFLVSALLSELVNEKAIKASHIRVGGSPLYYIEGQDEQLEKFSNFLNHKEREALALLKKEGVLQDSNIEPAIRVAIRDVKDFAVPLKASKGSNEILFWKYKFFKEADGKIKEILKTEKEIEKPAEKETENKEISEKPEKAEKKERKKGDANKLLEDWAAENKVIVKEILAIKGKEARAKIAVKSEIGEIDFMLVLKSKKSISESDLSLAYQEGLNSKLPVIFLTNGKISKQCKEALEKIGGNIIFRKL